MRKKRFAIVSLVICTIMSINITVFAAGNPSIWSITTNTKFFAPYQGVATTSSYNNYNGGGDFVYVSADKMWYNAMRISEIVNDWNSYGNYPGIDISDNGTANGDKYITNTGWYSTNLPNPKFENEDDPYPFGNGVFEESEITILSPNKLSDSIAYYFKTEFVEYSNFGQSFANEFHVSAQRNIINVITDEANAWDTCTLTYVDWISVQ